MMLVIGISVLAYICIVCKGENETSSSNTHIAPREPKYALAVVRIDDTYTTE
jgi:hypothetical protein